MASPANLLLRVIALLAVSASAQAVPGSYVFVDDARCDAHTIEMKHELGEAPEFPLDELIVATSAVLELPLTCSTLGPGDGTPDDYFVFITNLSPISWIDLFFVADAGILFGNVDGTIDDGNAFAIDKVGINAPLLDESLLDDLIFEPGETWTFIVEDWRFVAVPDIMGSIGVGSKSDSTGSSWSSIVANCLPRDCPTPVPAPPSLWLAALALAALSLRRQQKNERSCG